MAEAAADSVQEPVPGTPGIREVRSETAGTQSFGFATEMGGGDRSLGIRKVGLRAEIDTSPPFGSVKEAVTRFGGSGPWVPLYKLGETLNEMEEFDIKKVEEQTAELEKDLIVKELETLDVLEELSTTKKIVEELKLQLQKESLKYCIKTPMTQTTPTPSVIKEMNKEHNIDHSLSFHPSPVSSPDLILMELKQAKLNLGKTINDLGAIQSSVETLNKKMQKERSRVSMETSLHFQGEKFKKLAQNVSRSVMGSGENKYSSMKTAEMRWFAAKKLEEAAKAAEALAVAEIKAFSGNNDSPALGFVLPEPNGKPDPEKFNNHNNNNNNNDFRSTIMKMMEEAVSEVKESKSALEEALNRVDVANKKQIAAGEALRRSCATPEYSPAMNKINLFQPSDHPYHHHHDRHNNYPSPLMNEPMKPVLRPTVSMRDVLSRKQNEGQNVNHTNERQQKVALSQMLQELREDLTFPKKPETDHNSEDHKQQMFTQRRKFGFIHISLPLTRHSKKKVQTLN